MFVLDNDTLTLFLKRHDLIVRRVLSVPPYDLWLPAIAVEEQFRGRLAYLNGLNPARRADSLRLPEAYELLVRTQRQLSDFQVLPYTAEMEDLYQSWPPAVRRIGTRDCRIAATAIVKGFTVVTRNLRHFGAIPGVRAEDWSR